MSRIKPDHPLVLASIVLVMLLVLVAELRTALGVAVWVFYMVPVALCLLQRRPALPVVVAGAATAFIVAGYGVDPMAAVVEPWVALLNRAFGLAAVWAIALTVRQVIAVRLVAERQAWLKMGESGLSERLRGEQGLHELGDNALRFLAGYLDAHVGAAFVSSADGLHRFGGYALDASPAGGAAPQALQPGQGLVRQAALQARVMHVRDLPPDYLTIRSGLGAGSPRELLLAPLLADGAVNGVLELGFLRAVDPLDIELLTLVAEPLGIALRSVLYRGERQELLEETQRQAEELQAQQEELRVSNEELEEQGNALRVSQARLEDQQAELEQINVQLEEHTQALTQAQVELAAHAAGLERANQYKSEFLANMSHELRTPLNSTLILAKLLADNAPGNLTPEQVEFARTISAAGNDLLELINDILDLAKVEAGKVDVHPEEVRLDGLLEALSPTFRPIAEEKGLALRLSVDATAPELIQTDPLRLRQILKNLLSNALKFTERGEVGLRVFSPGAGQVGFAVHDTGIGVPLDQRQVIFEAFRQADGASNRKHAGTGLGLSISRELAGLLGGRIEVDGAVGVGSTFTLVLPARYSPAAPARASRAAPPVKASRPPGAADHAAPRPPAARDDRDQLEPRGRALLVIEDDAAFARILSDLAHELHYHCLVARTADEGVELARRHRPTAIVLDVGLPDHSGLVVLDQLKRSPETRHIPVQVVSAQDCTQAALEMGAVGYILKPVKREELIDALTRVEQRLAREVRTVLVVEDDAAQQESLRALLAGKDIEVVTVGSATAALERLASSTIDCMVLDLALPDASGFELLERMARDEAYSFPPVIVHTGRTLSADEEQRLRRYSRSIIVKGAHSPERLVDEVALFLHQVEADLPLERRRMLRVARDREAALEDRRILIVEDDVRNVFALSSILEPRGAQVQIARNGKEALAALDAAPVDLVLMDIMMPEMDGYEAMREVRKRPACSKLPIIALTARAMKDDQRRCLDAGANDYIAKPLDVDKLLSMIRVWLPRRA